MRFSFTGIDPSRKLKPSKNPLWIMSLEAISSKRASLSYPGQYIIQNNETVTCLQESCDCPFLSHMVENGKKVLKDRKCSPATLYACLKAEDQSFSCSCIHLLTTIMENQQLGKRSSSSATCISFALSSKMCVLILSLMNNNPLLNRKATCHFPQDQSGRHKTQNSCPLADAHLFYKPQRPVLMSIHKST